MKYLNNYSNESLMNFKSLEDYTNTSCNLPEEVVNESMDYLLWMDQLDANESLLKLSSYENHMSTSCNLPEGVVSVSMDYLVFKDFNDANSSLLNVGTYKNHMYSTLEFTEAFYKSEYDNGAVVRLNDSVWSEVA